MRHFNWTPGIGDPTPIGWLTVVFYLVTAYVTWGVARRLRAACDQARSEAVFWTIIAGLFLALGINKQLDIQSAFTEVGRMIASAQGWYERRWAVQAFFVGLVTGCAATTAITLLVLLRRAPASALLALLGTAFVLTFVVVRAASFHHVDVLIGTKFLGLRWNWIFEIGGILIVLAAARMRRNRFLRLGDRFGMRRPPATSGPTSRTAGGTSHGHADHSQDPAPSRTRQPSRR